MVSTGAFVCALAPVCAVACLASSQRKPKVPALVATGANALYQYRLQHDVVLFWPGPLARFPVVKNGY